MEEWKVRQEVYHRLKKEYDDDLKTKNVTISDNIVDNAIAYFVDRNIGWIYPAKSYMVAICYARWLEEHFGGDRYDYLNDPELLHNNDPYFVEYSRHPRAYHEILESVTWEFDEEAGLVPDVKKYFLEEFMIDD